MRAGAAGARRRGPAGRGRGREALLAGLLVLSTVGCAGRTYPHGRGLVGQLEAEIVALHQRTRALEEAALACEDVDDPGSAYRQLVAILPQDHRVEVRLQRGIVGVILPWEHALSEGEGEGAGPTMNLPAVMSLDFVSGVLDSHPGYGLAVIGRPRAEAGAGAAAVWPRAHQGAQVVAAQLVDRFGQPVDRVVVGTGVAGVAGLPEASHLELRLLPGLDDGAGPDDDDDTEAAEAAGSEAGADG